MLRCNIRAIKRGKKRMKRNKVLRGGPEPLIFFSLMHRASCHAASPVLAHTFPPFNSSNFSFIRAISLVRFHPRARFFCTSLTFLPSSLSPNTLIRGPAPFFISSSPPLGYSHFRAISRRADVFTDNFCASRFTR